MTTDTHLELIRCPECGSHEQAAVEHSFPWWSYAHHCTKCNFIITESDWERI